MTSHKQSHLCKCGQRVGQCERSFERLYSIMKLLKHWQLHLVQKSALIAVAVDTAVERLCPLLQSVRTISTPVAVSIAHAALVLPNITSSFLSTLLSFLFSFGLAVLFALVLTLPLSSFVSSAFALQFTTASTATRKLTPAFAFLFFFCLPLPFSFSSILATSTGAGPAL